MNFDFSEILLEVVKHKASDLHITSGAPPMIRVSAARSCRSRACRT